MLLRMDWSNGMIRKIEDDGFRIRGPNFGRTVDYYDSPLDFSEIRKQRHCALGGIDLD